MKISLTRTFLLPLSCLLLNFCAHEAPQRGPLSPHEQANPYRQPLERNYEPHEPPPQYHREKNVDQAVEELKWRNTSLKDKVRSLYGQIEDCHHYLIDPRLGGSYDTFRLPELEPVEKSTAPEKVGYNRSGDYTVSQTESYGDVLARERRIGKKLEQDLLYLKDNYRRCKAKLTNARLKYGLPAEKYPAIVKKMPDGNLKVVVPAERNLDDAFKRRKRELRQD